MKLTNIVRLLFSALFLLAIITPAHADTEYEVYAPVPANKARSLKQGSQIAFACGGCGAVTTTTVDKNRNYLHGFTCPSCKRKFVTQSLGGNVGSVTYSYEDDAGHHATLLQKLHIETRYNAHGQAFSLYAR